MGVVLPALLVLTIRPRGLGPATMSTPSDALPDFVLEDQEGRLIRASKLREKPVVISFFFTSCKSICPITAARLVRLQQALASEDVEFVSFSIDPERDGTAARHEYAERWAPGERRWHLLAPSADGLADIATGLGLNGRSTADVHTTSLMLLAPGGRVYRRWAAETPLADEVAAVFSLLHPREPVRPARERGSR